MKKKYINGLSLWQFENFEKLASIKHFVTSRQSNSDSEEFTLSLSSLPDKEKVRSNRKMLATAMCIPDTQLYFPSQVHKTNIVHVTQQTRKEELMETDALMTNEKSVCIAVMSADCVPILLYDATNKVVAAVHSGWRGTVAKILKRTLGEMQSRYGTTGKDLIAGIGPSVCQESYEVGEEVVREVTQAFSNPGLLMIPQPNNKAKLDLWKANKLQLLEFGVEETCIEISNLCSVKNNNDFFSARKGDTGRFAAGIMLS
jgi:hypothetical protein